MSEYLQCRTQIRDLHCLVEALMDMGWKREQIESHETPRSLYGYHNDVRTQTAHVIIRRQHVRAGANDIGFLRRPDGSYEAIISEFDRSQGNNTAWLGRLQQNYNFRVIAQEARRQGVALRSERRTDGSVRVVVQAR